MDMTHIAIIVATLANIFTLVLYFRLIDMEVELKRLRREMLDPTAKDDGRGPYTWGGGPYV